MRLLSRACLLTALLAVLALLPAAAAQCEPPCLDLSGRVAYINPFGQLAIVDPAQGEPRLLSPVGTAYRFPAFAPDGRRIAAVGTVGGAGVVSIFGDDDPQVVYRSETEPPIYLYWSPDGVSLSFIAARAETGLGFHIAEPTGAPRLVATGSPFYWAWARDASSILVHVGLGEDDARLAFADPVAGIDEFDVDAPGLFRTPGISPSGRFIAYAAVRPGGERRVIVASHPNVAGEIVERELAHQGFAVTSWSPVADVVAVMFPPQPATHWFGPIRVLDAEDGLLETVTEELALAFFWSPDGEKLAWLSPVAAQDVRQVVDARAGARLRGFARPADTVAAPVQRAPLRLRLRVAYMDGVQVGDVQTLATFVPSADFVNQFLPFFDQYALSHRIWAPDSESLVVPMVRSDGVARVVIVGLDASERELAQGDMPFWNVR